MVYESIQLIVDQRQKQLRYDWNKAIIGIGLIKIAMLVDAYGLAENGQTPEKA